MSAAETLWEARTAGIELRVEGGDLALQAPAPPPADLLERLTRHKPDIVALLRPGRDGWSAEDWQAYFEERAGIAEFDGGLTHLEAEALAFDCCVVERMHRTFEGSPPGRCRACGGGDHVHDVLVLYGTEPTGHVWLHSRCWHAWHAARKAEAAAALFELGIPADRTNR
jgi:hypothetical protein